VYTSLVLWAKCLNASASKDYFLMNKNHNLELFIRIFYDFYDFFSSINLVWTLNLSGMLLTFFLLFVFLCCKILCHQIGIVNQFFFKCNNCAKQFLFRCLISIFLCPIFFSSSIKMNHLIYLKLLQYTITRFSRLLSRVFFAIDAG